ncbi:cathepsin L-like [Mytilus edulis]|uniref:cathepsin L-like n=1 Tax=Mytilus edulis TaxID=6550 RepID=UPI0039EE380F
MKLLLFVGLVGHVFCVGGFGSPGSIAASEIPDQVIEATKQELQKQNLVYTDTDLRAQASNVQRQVVAGYIYKYTLTLNTADGRKQECTFKIWYKEWAKFVQVEQSDCKPAGTVKRQLGGGHFLAGGVSAADCNSDKFQIPLQEAVRHVNMMSNSMFHMTPVQVTKCTSQVVAGMKYTMNVDFQQSETCRNDQDHMTSLLADCPPSNSATHTDHFQCTVIDAPWHKTQYETDCKMVQTQPKPKFGNDGHDLCHGGMFKDFQKKHQKFYSTEEEEKKRFGIFCENMKTVRMIQEKEQGTAVYGATKFADLTEKEFKKYVGKKWNLIKNTNKDMKQAFIRPRSIPESFDWRDHNAVSDVKNQGSCGSCWAFSTTGNIEGQWAIQKKQLVSLSEQELVSCDKVDQGCEGGLPSNAYKEIERLGGLETESEYKYDGVDEKCTFNRSDAKFYVNGSLSISSDEKEMAQWLYENGPISIGINAFMMQFYMGGISHPWKIFCNPKELDHGVLIVGYGVDGSKPYWIVKNSWGPDWGEKGYYLVYRGDGVCGLNTMCTSAIVK